jgi:hypothetical protein
MKHCSTRWLSLERAIKRLLILWPALYAYFYRETVTGKSDNEHMKRVAKTLSSIEAKLFSSLALKPLNLFNAAFQTSACKLGTLQRDVSNLLQSFFFNFIQPQLLAAT